MKTALILIVGSMLLLIGVAGMPKCQDHLPVYVGGLLVAGCAAQ